MRGDRLAVGEETALFDELWLRPDTTIAYSPGLVVEHRVAPWKLSVRYQLRRAAAAGDAWAVRQNLAKRGRARRIATDLGVAVTLTVRALLRLRRPFRRWAVEELAPVAGRLGSMRGAFR
jgi:hypothetical protein